MAILMMLILPIHEHGGLCSFNCSTCSFEGTAICDMQVRRIDVIRLPGTSLFRTFGEEVTCYMKIDLWSRKHMQF